MERRFELRKRQLLDDAELKSELSKGMLGRLETFVEPFAVTLRRREMKENAQQYVGGLLSDLERKNVESIAYRCDRDRRAFQRFIGIAPWDFRPLEKELVCRVSQWAASSSEKDWTTIDVRDGEKGPFVLEITKRCVVARTEHSRN